VPKAFEIAEGFSKMAKLAWPAFRSGGRCAAGFSKDNCSLQTFLVGLKTGKFDPWPSFKSSPWQGCGAGAGAGAGAGRSRNFWPEPELEPVY
jgi:hypothetical protein